VSVKCNCKNKYSILINCDSNVAMALHVVAKKDVRCHNFKGLKTFFKFIGSVCFAS